MKKLEAVNFISLVTLAISFFYMIRIDNQSRLPANINTDYYMNSLPFIYLIIGSLAVLIIVAFLRMRYLRKEKWVCLKSKYDKLRKTTETLSF